LIFNSPFKQKSRMNDIFDAFRHFGGFWDHSYWDC
jgi:hypothetical protein